MRERLTAARRQVMAPAEPQPAARPDSTPDSTEVKA